ncbi:unnamed protein product [Rhizophagus irregularis]|nr:unnamed protein product [Rhizophagus irregularis]
MYGSGANEILLSKVLKERKPEYVRQACENSLRRLGVNYIDLYYQHRVDPNTPIEDTVGALAELVKEGKIKYIGLSECSAESLRRAYKVHPIAAVQMEYSPWTLDIETNGVLEACHELGVTIVAYSPLGRGFLTGKYKSLDDFEPDDFRRDVPRFQGENFNKNLEIVHKFDEFGGVMTLLLFLVQEKSNIWKKILKARKIHLSSEELSEIRKIIDSIEIIGTRYSEDSMKFLNV